MVPNECWLIDLDGVVWLADEAIPGSAQALDDLRATGRRPVFFTNNSFDTRAVLLAKFERLGIELDPSELASSAEAAAALLEPGQRTLVLGGPGILEALVERGVEAVPAFEIRETDHFDAVVVGIDWELDYERLTAATRAVIAGARLIGTNDDATYPSPTGLRPGAGALLSAVSFASGRAPTIAGKPHAAAAALVGERFGPIAVVIGDRPSTDGLFARRLNARFGLVYSGVTEPDGAVADPAPDLAGESIATLVAALTARD